ILLIDLAQHLLDGALVELDDVLEDEEHAAHLLGEALVGAREVLEHVALERAVGVVEDPGESPGPAGRGVLLLATAVSLCRRTSSTCWITRELVSPMRAMRSATSGCWRSGRCESTPAARLGCR